MASMEDGLSIGELADAAGVSRRAVRFYVQQRLIDPPAGVGRGRHYGTEHLNQLRRIHELQTRGHSLEEIRQIVSGRQQPSAPPVFARRRQRALVAAELWTRLRIAEGIELNFDARKFSPAAEELAALRDAIRRTFGLEHLNLEQHDGGPDESDAKDDDDGDAADSNQ
ncbi:MAG TPA: MerR family transcriptional regulator [Tepidisphaeraceae bacterium]|jgi:DNA-binding transcriptional MerR regulator